MAHHWLHPDWSDSGSLPVNTPILAVIKESITVTQLCTFGRELPRLKAKGNSYAYRSSNVGQGATSKGLTRTVDMLKRNT